MNTKRRTPWFFGALPMCFLLAAGCTYEPPVNEASGGNGGSGGDSGAGSAGGGVGGVGGGVGGMGAAHRRTSSIASTAWMMISTDSPIVRIRIVFPGMNAYPSRRRDPARMCVFR